MTPPSAASVARAKEIVTNCDHAGAPAFAGQLWGACTPCIAVALDARERETWEAAADECDELFAHNGAQLAVIFRAHAAASVEGGTTG